MAAPNIPTALTVTATSDSLRLGWVRPAGGDAPTHYEVRLNVIGPVIDTGALLSHTFAGLQPQQAHWLEVRAVNADGASQWVMVQAVTLAAPAPITLEQVRAYIGVPATALPDDQLQTMLDAALEDQGNRCAVDPYTDALVQALYRRVQREVASKNLPLGMVGIDAEYGPQRIPVFDALIEDHERPYRLQVVG